MKYCLGVKKPRYLQLVLFELIFFNITIITYSTPITVHAADLLRCEIFSVEEFNTETTGRRLQQVRRGVVIEGRVVYLTVSEDLATIAVEEAEDLVLVMENLDVLDEVLEVALPEGVKVILVRASDDNTSVVAERTEEA
jgi:hypothetical protein